MRILMLHGYAQNGSIFRHKLRRLEESIRVVYPNVTFKWLDGPVQLRTNAVPDVYEVTPKDLLDLRGWFDLRDEAIEQPPAALGESLALVADVLARDGPFDGIIAFSQGTTIATMVASLLEDGRRQEAFASALRCGKKIMPYPDNILNSNHPPLRFAILYATRLGEGHLYRWLYSDPAIQTPFCNFIGEWDPMLGIAHRDAVRQCLTACSTSSIILHQGAHFVPTTASSVSVLLDFLSDVQKEAPVHVDGASKDDDAVHPACSTDRQEKSTRKRVRRLIRARDFALQVS
ncbi:Family of serine hydrolases 3 [Recurvomyces mirabilis]|nr:Family of serine hydrolases 3 [Recurvomyces mirabilis]